MAPRTGLEEISPELVGMMAEYFGVNEEEALQKLLYAQAGKARETPMPAGITVRDQYIAPSVLGTAASTIERIRGGEDEQKALAKLQAGLLRKNQINDAAMQADMARRQAGAAADQYNSIQATQPQPGASTPLTPSDMGGDVVRDWVAEGYDPNTGFIGVSPTPPRPTLPRLMDTSPQRGRGYTGSPLYGWGDTQGVNRRK